MRFRLRVEEVPDGSLFSHVMKYMVREEVDKYCLGSVMKFYAVKLKFLLDEALVDE